MTAYHVVIGVIHVVHVILEELTSGREIWTHSLPRRGSMCVFVHEEIIERIFALGTYSHGLINKQTSKKKQEVSQLCLLLKKR